MTSERWDKIKEIFESALEMAAEDRPVFVERAARGDAALRDEVMRLLAEFEKAGSFLAEPAGHLNQSVSPQELIAGRYRVIRLLGRGGMGEVYEVRDQLLNEAQAFKTLRSELCDDPGILRRFQSEIQLARRVTHPNVCRVFEVGVHEYAGAGRPPLHFFTMQLLQGETLAARIHRLGRMSRQEAFPLIVQMAKGLEAAHDEGVIHRDFKSANVIVTGNRAIITDFGLAGLEPGQSMNVPAGSISTGMRIAGTVAYMSPEQMEGGPITPASDIYSLGIVLFEMATGRLPYEDHHVVQSAMQRARGTIPSVRGLVPDVDPRWESAIRRCLEAEPSRRFRSAAEIAGLFEQGKWRLPRPYWSRRKWAQVMAGSAILVAAGGGYWTWSRRPYEPKHEALVWFEKGVGALRSATYEAARRDLEQAVDIDPRYAPAYAYLAAAYSDLDMSERAKETMLKAVAVSQDERLSRIDAMRVKAMQYFISRDFDRAVPLFEQLRDAAPEREKAGAYLELAWLAQKSENIAGMAPALELALRLNPSLAGAKLRLALAVDRQGKKDTAGKLFEEAEALFRTASDYDGVVEALLQHAISLARANKTPEAAALVERGMAVAASIQDVRHEIQLQLALALAYRNSGEIARSRQVAERATTTAVEHRMDATTAIGLLDLGNGYALRGEPEQAERYYQQGLEFAARGRAIFSEARARLSLGSFYVQYDRPTEALPHIQRAQSFFRNAGYQRELMQSVLLLGGAQESLAEFEDAEKSQRQAIRLAEQIHDIEQIGLAHLYLGSALAKLGRWPESIEQRSQALTFFGEVRGGYRAAFTLLARGRLQAQMGRFGEALADLAQARARIERLQGKQAQLRARTALGEAEAAAYQTRWADALRLARHATGLNGGADENIEAEMLTGLAMIHLGRIEPGRLACEHAIRVSLEKSRPYLAARNQLSLAEALRDKNHSYELAREAIRFFGPRRVWEAVWRCHKVLCAASAAREDHIRSARVALDEVKKLWPEEMVRSYIERPDLKN